MKKRMIIKTGLMAILVVVIMAVNIQDIKCDESGGTYYTDINHVIPSLMEQ